MFATEEAERERTVVVAAAEADQKSTVYDELDPTTIIEMAPEIAAVVPLPPGERSLFHHSSLIDFANYPTYYAHLVDSIVVVALLDSATNCLWHPGIQ